MFTGLIEHLGRVLKSEKGGARMTFRTPFAKLTLGESVAVDGVCLTVVSRKKSGKHTDFAADLSEETLKKTSLGRKKAGDAVNLERSMRADARFGGHFVQGHVDGTGAVAGITPQGQSKLYAFSFPKEMEAFLAPKGSIAVDGVSLTIVEAKGGVFTVSVIPYTEEGTTLGLKKPGDPVNLEADILAKLVTRQVQLALRERQAEEFEDLFVKKELRWEDLPEKGSDDL
jgi:riboflavin synthase